ncbi:hypothetical protein TSOC_009751 [Tetrabaena socialis]|uniref:Uncharacterized protein n=1 Tax=Tetrabaena socialis TaxID=47790 RepID=A0A2J7ZV28_9CHLO|nr:hypothetical protein TSOC_009751 [Tetrabaena socialis]|eukprot:PNH04125.1 hypothetical protein TSOC_009751 [Tetrabaena socialis]
MGSLFSKDKKAKAGAGKGEPTKPGSAPSRLEGLDGTTPPPTAAKRALTPDITSRAIDTRVSPVAISAADASPSPASTTSPVEPQKPTIVVPGSLAARAQEPASSSAPDAQPQAADADSGAFSPGGGGGDLTPTRRAPKKTDYVGAQTDGTKLAADLPAAVQVQVPEEASPWLAVLGENTVRSLYSPDWKTREHALQAVMRSIGNVRWNAERAPEDVWTTITQLLDKSLK